jgi:mRNA interferase MazF
VRPFVVVQNNLFNRSRINTVVVCAVTSNLRRARDPGNVLLAPGEANLSGQSVINVSQVFTVDKGDLQHRIGTLDRERVREIVDGLRLLLEPREAGW